MSIKVGIEERFWPKVEKSDECWNWIGALNRNGYGLFSVNRRSRLAHRVAWEIANGAAPGKLHVCHHCDNPKCVNPSHLFLGTAADNAHDRDKKGRVAAGDRHYSRRFPGIRAGDRCPVAKLSSDDVRSIRRRVTNGEKQATIAREFGVSQSAISNIVRRRDWKTVQ